MDDAKQPRHVPILRHSLAKGGKVCHSYKCAPTQKWRRGSGRKPKRLETATGVRKLTGAGETATGFALRGPPAGARRSRPGRGKLLREQEVGRKRSCGFQGWRSNSRCWTISEKRSEPKRTPDGPLERVTAEAGAESGSGDRNEFSPRVSGSRMNGCNPLLRQKRKASGAGRARDGCLRTGAILPAEHRDL